MTPTKKGNTMKKMLPFIPLLFLPGCALTAFGLTPKGAICMPENFQGSWRLEYKETGGTCGPQPTETVNLNGPIPEGCSLRQQMFDGCDYLKTVTCPAGDGGSRTWAATLKETFVWELNGSGTVQIKRPSGSCQSTYAIVATKL